VLITALTLIAGVVLLVAGAEVLVRGASRIAILAGVSPLVIGLTIVAYGTSAPEAAVSIMAGLANQPDIAVGNVVGSNIANVLLILGLSALAAPLIVAQQLVRLDVPIMIGISVLVLLFGWNGSISAAEGTILVIGAVAYTAFLIRQSRKEKSQEVRQEYEQEFSAEEAKKSGIGVNVLLVLGGLAILILGSRFLVTSAVAIAQRFGVSELVIGLTIVAVGTSLPELATSVIASLRGERDIAVGNVVGSNIFNLLLVLGAAGIAAPAGVTVSPSALRGDIPIMIAVAVLCLPVFFRGTIGRFSGLMFVGYYVAYTTWLILTASARPGAATLERVMLWVVIPVTVITLLIGLVRAKRSAPEQLG
jgi:cation:H+ antiporter